MEPRRPGKLEALLTLASIAVATWYMIPGHDREQIKMQATARLQRLSARLAWREGHRGMGDELAGRDWQRYSVAYRLSQLRDRLAQVLEEMRP